MAEAEASLSTSIDSMSETLICERFPASPSGNPLTTMSGVFEPSSELLPRMRMTAPEPGSCEVFITCRPAARPCSSPSTEVEGMLVRSFILTEATEPVRSLFLTAP